MKSKLFTKIFLILTIISVFSIACFNYLINPYGVFNHKIASEYIQEKDHLASHRMTLFYGAIYSNPKNLLIGTSRMGLLPTPKKYIPNDLSNIWMPGANIEEQTTLIRYMISKFPIEKIVWSLDFHSFNPELYNDPNFSYNRLNPDISYKDDYNLALFGYQTTIDSFKTLKDNLGNFKLQISNSQNEQIKSTEYGIKEVKNKIKKKVTQKKKNAWDKKVNAISKVEVDFETAKQLKHYPNKYLKFKTFNNPKSIDESLIKVKEIINLCKKNNIQLYVYTSPVHTSFLDLYKTLGINKTFIYWKQELSKITNYTDFCNVNSITKDKYNFLDGSHLKPSLGYMLYAKIFNDSSINTPKDFGILIEKEQ